MKKPLPTLFGTLPAIEKSLTKSGFKVSLIQKNNESASYAVQGTEFKKNYFQVLKLVQNRPDFAIVEIFVSNLSITEKWSDIEISVDILPEYLSSMMKIAAEELSKTIATDEKLEAIVSQIEDKEPKLAELIKQLHNLEDHLEPKHIDQATRKKFEAQLAKVEASCLKHEMEISRLAFRYFTNTIDPVDAFFYDALLSANWAEKPASKKKSAKKATPQKSISKKTTSKKVTSKKTTKK